MLLVHGAVDSGRGFADVVRRLNNCEVVTYDRRGNGAAWATLPSASNLDDHVDDLIDRLDETPSVVVGHSLGGAVALAAALRRPDLVSGLAVYETALPAEPWWTEQERAEMMSTIASNTAQALARAGRDAERRARAAASWEGCRRDVLALSANAIDWRSLAVPLTVGVGTANKGASVRDARWLAKELSADLVVLRGATHLAHRSQPALFAGLVRRAVTNAARVPAQAATTQGTR